jgi:hypothetical protein
MILLSLRIAVAIAAAGTTEARSEFSLGFLGLPVAGLRRVGEGRHGKHGAAGPSPFLPLQQASGNQHVADIARSRGEPQPPLDAAILLA